MEGEYAGEELRIEVREHSCSTDLGLLKRLTVTWFDTVTGGSGGTASSACHSG